MNKWKIKKDNRVPIIYKCYRCGLEGNETVINREGQLHYGTDLHCFDRKNCERRIRKNKNN